MRSIYAELDNFLNMTDFDGISTSTVSLEKKVPEHDALTLTGAH